MDNIEYILERIGSLILGLLRIAFFGVVMGVTWVLLPLLFDRFIRGHH